MLKSPLFDFVFESSLESKSTQDQRHWRRFDNKVEMAIPSFQQCNQASFEKGSQVEQWLK